MLRYLTAGESHGQALVVVMEGLPAGLPITVEQIQVEMGRRRLGYGRGPRQRFEADELTLIGGVRHGRTLGSPIAIEMTALTAFGAASLALATSDDRSRAMSLVASGFLTLFAVAISDSPYAVWIAIAWMTICVWHLVANHWERLELCSVETVRRGPGVRPVSVFAAVTICIVSGLVVVVTFPTRESTSTVKPRLSTSSTMSTSIRLTSVSVGMP